MVGHHSFPPLLRLVHFVTRLAEFVWEARARTGEVRKGSMEAANEDAVNERLRSQQLKPTKVKKKGEGVQLPDRHGRRLEGHRHLHAPVRHDDRRRPAHRAVPRHPRRVRPTTSSSPRSCATSRRSVEQGATFSDSLRRHPKVFDPLYTNLVQAGEVGGILDTILNRLAVYIEKAMKLRRQVRGAMVYPSIVLVRLRRRAVDPARVRHSRLPEHVQGLRRQGRAAGAHPGRHRRVARLRRQLPSAFILGRHGGSSSLSRTSTRRRAGKQHRSTSSC